MELLLKRRFKGPQYTIGSLYVNGKLFCDTLEDVDRGLTDSMTVMQIRLKKTYGETAIPTGTYKVDMNTISPKYSDFKKYPYTKKYGGKIPRILNIKGFEGVLIHPGNTDKDTLGCILVGRNLVKGKVLQSQDTWSKLMEILLTDKDDITIKIE